MHIPDRDAVNLIFDYFLKPGEVAAMLGLGLGAVYWHTQKGRLKPICASWGCRLYDPQEVRQLADELKKYGRRRIRRPDRPQADKGPRGD
jgi:hypothetical protein